MIIQEPYTAGFTGTLKTIVNSRGLKFTLDGDGPHVVQGQPFVLQIDDVKGQIRLIPVHLPHPMEGRTR